MIDIVESNPCADNPCDPGICSVAANGRVQCNCEGTLHIGERCDTSYIHIDPIQLLMVNRTYFVDIISQLPENLELSLHSSEPSKLTTIPQSIVLHRSEQQQLRNYRINANQPGLYSVHYDVDSYSGNVLDPEDSVVLVSDTSVADQETAEYFDRLGLEEGVVDPGCCSHLVSAGQSQCFSDLQFSSSCKWVSEGDSQSSSKGIVFVGNRAIDLPLSIAGVSTTSSSDSSVRLTSPISHVKECGVCSKYQSPDCNSLYDSINFDVHDTSMLLQANSLVKTALSRIKHIFPSWLSVNTWSPSYEYSIHDYRSSLMTRSELLRLPNCAAPSNTGDILYYVLRTRATLHIAIDSFNTFLQYSSSLSPLCIVVDLCTDGDPKIFVNVPSNLQTSMLENLGYFRSLLSGDGSLEFMTLEMAENGIKQVLGEDQMYWDGNGHLQPTLPAFQFKVKAKFEKTFVGELLQIHCFFEGFAFHSSEIAENVRKLITNENDACD